ncbi:expressed unknown protein [Seminavis robusta]|uniref:Uncharacterized protein n=1 Tax=Seminavis robusta TaxID=568900 RepID=A0A9N8ECI7_9STRA|nr:expressed unknown protein [Seminavis robusta]|eukprot:Sro746_g196410.1 n/a (157) ;mRNA; r:26469-27111
MKKDLVEDHENETQAEAKAMAKEPQQETAGVPHDSNKESKMEILDNANTISKPTATDNVVAKPETVDSTLEEDGILKETFSPGKQEEIPAPFDCETAMVSASTVAEPLELRRDVRRRQQVTLPGAYMGALGEDLQRTTTLNYDLNGRVKSKLELPH